MAANDGTAAFREARDFLLEHRENYAEAYARFGWPQLGEFNWALDWFDVIAEGNDDPALWIVEEDGSEQRFSFAEMAHRSNRVASWLRERGVRRGDRIVMMLGNQVELWDTILAAMKLGAVIIPATPLLGAADAKDRVTRGGAQHVIALSSATDRFAEAGTEVTRIAVGAPVDGWHAFADAYTGSAAFTPDGVTGRPTPSCSTSRPGRPRVRSWSSTPTRPIPSGTCPPCTGSALSRATSTSTSRRRAGPSTRGATSSPRGTRRPACSSTTTPGSIRPGCCTRCNAAG
ncbi:hypothetical protein GCM10020358_41820 [Amorphoplanes nipponensis]